MGNQGYSKAEIDTKLNGKTDKTAVYTKEETDKKLAAGGGIKPAVPGYTKEEADAKFMAKTAAGSNAGNDSDKKFELKADKVSVYTRDEIDKKLGLKEDKGSLQMLAGMLEAKPMPTMSIPRLRQTPSSHSRRLLRQVMPHKVSGLRTAGNGWRLQSTVVAKAVVITLVGKTVVVATSSLITCGSHSNCWH